MADEAALYRMPKLIRFPRRQGLTCKRAGVPAVYIAGPHKLSIAANVFDDQTAMVQDRRPHNFIETVDSVLTRAMIVSIA
jgi:hypothetical protein